MMFGKFGMLDHVWVVHETSRRIELPTTIHDHQLAPPWVVEGEMESGGCGEWRVEGVESEGRRVWRLWRVGGVGQPGGGGGVARGGGGSG